MANWISSKLKVAETFFEQIDQQAAESLKKNERSVGSEGQELNVPAKTGGGDKTVSLKDQFKKKSTLDQTNIFVIDDNHSRNVEYMGKLNTDPSINNVNNNNGNNYNHSNGGLNEIANVSKPKSTLTDSDWTELLSTTTTQVRSNNRSTGSPAIRGLRKDVRKQGVSGSGSNLKNNLMNGRGGLKSRKGLDVALGDNKSNGKPNDEIEDAHSSSSARSSNVELHIDGKTLDREEVDHKDIGVNLTEEEKNKGSEKSARNMSVEDLMIMGNKSGPPSQVSSLVSKRIDGVSDLKKGANIVYDRLRRTVNEKDQSSTAASGSSVSDDLRKGSSTSDGESDTDSDSVSTSDSENEREREMREKLLAEQAAAKALEAIKERENMVARLEGEKQSLEKILEERAKQQAQEALDLQTTTMETMEAVELEKQKHNNTRMEALACLAKLETTNADLARSLATAQKNIEMENNRVAELRQKLLLKEVSHEELRRNIFKTRHTGTFLNQAAASKGVKFEREILEAEYSFLTDKIAVLEDKAKKLEENIELTRKDIEDPTEIEIELKRRLSQLTDHLIQKQAQVEALSSEKATLLLRIEAVSRLLDENGSNSGDLESGTWEMPDSKLRPLFGDKIRSGRKHLGSLVKQLDAIFMAGAVFVRRNPTAKLWSLVYLVCLHFWVLYIFLSHSQVSEEGRSSAVLSLENINQTAGV